uniref:Uncharacterized protein n=1 Tax=Octopus bimaculoides TaxID=37653 RepID=A0A0L8HM02_OCTBM
MHIIHKLAPLSKDLIYLYTQLIQTHKHTHSLHHHHHHLHIVKAEDYNPFICFTLF